MAEAMLVMDGRLTAADFEPRYPERVLVIDLDAGVRQLGELHDGADFAAYVPEPGDALVRVPCLDGAAA